MGAPGGRARSKRQAPGSRRTTRGTLFRWRTVAWCWVVQRQAGVLAGCLPRACTVAPHLP